MQGELLQKQLADVQERILSSPRKSAERAKLMSYASELEETMMAVQRAELRARDDAWTFDSLEESGAQASLAALVESEIVNFDTEREFWCGDGVERSGWLLACLRVNHMEEAQAAKVACRFASFREEQGWAKQLCASEVSTALCTGHHWLLPGRDLAGRSIVVQRIATLDPCVCPVTEYQKMGCYLMQKVIDSKTAQREGVTLVYDLRGVSIGVLTAMGPTDARRGVAMWQEAFPCKLRRIFVISPGYFSSIFIDMVKSFVSEKIRQRITILSPDDLSPIHDEIPLDALPREFGGNLDAEVYWHEWCDARLREESGERSGCRRGT